MSTQEERNERTLHLAQALLAATQAMEDGDWVACEKKAYAAAREARMLLLLDREEEREKEG